MVARRWLPSTSVGFRSSRRSSSRSRPRRCVAIVLPARSGRRCPTAQASFKNALNLRCEDRVAVIDRVLRITDQTSEAELMRLRQARSGCGRSCHSRQSFRRDHALTCRPIPSPGCFRPPENSCFPVVLLKFPVPSKKIPSCLSPLPYRGQGAAFMILQPKSAYVCR
jgi:hypothetical protein